MGGGGELMGHGGELMLAFMGQWCALVWSPNPIPPRSIDPAGGRVWEARLPGTRGPIGPSWGIHMCEGEMAMWWGGHNGLVWGGIPRGMLWGTHLLRSHLFAAVHLDFGTHCAVGV